jgi:hypothetical protein
MNEFSSPLPQRLPGAGYWFSEDSSFKYGVMLDLSVFRADAYEEEALYQRFRARLLAEYDRLAPQIAAAYAEPDACPINSIEDLPISISVPQDEWLYLEIVPTLITRQKLVRQLPTELRKLVAMIKRPESYFAESAFDAVGGGDE